MLYCIANTSSPADYVSCGKLINQEGFLHDHRCLDCFVLLLVCEGTLHIEQNGKKFDVGENEALLLFPGFVHLGYKPSAGKLSYYWVHFSLPKEEYHICTQNGLSQGSKNHGKTWSPALVSLERSYLLLPEYSLLSAQKRSTVLFVQLLDMAKRDNYQATLRCKYALNLLLLEFAAEAQTADSLTNHQTPRKVREMIEWIRAHYDEPLTVSSLAEQFHYHPTYLTALFKKHTGYSVSAYISYIRIESAKNILCSTDTLSVREAAYLCGFDDEKYFMRLFKKLEGVTPSQYRNAFFEKKVNRR